MSFWNTLQKSVSNTFDHIKSDVASPVSSTWNDFYGEMYWAATEARAAIGLDSQGELDKARREAGVVNPMAPQGSFMDMYKSNANAGTAAVGHAMSMTENTPIVGTVVGGLMYGLDTANRGLTTAAIAGAQGGSPFDGANWSRSWNATAHDKPGDLGITFGEAMLADDQDKLLDPNQLAKYREEIASSWGNQLLVEGLNFAGYFATDPTRGIGRALKAGRVANRIESSVQADHVFDAAQDIEFAGAKGARHGAQVKDFVTPNGMGSGPSAAASLDTIDRFIIKHTEQSRFGKDALPDFNEMSTSLQRVARNGGGEGTSSTLLHLLNQANKIEEPTLRLTTKRNVMLAGAGSHKALDALVKDSPEVARAMQRMGSAPEGVHVLDDLASAGLRPDLKFSEIAESLAENPANKAELGGLAKSLDAFHGRLNELDSRLYAMTDDGRMSAQMNPVVGLTGFDKLAAGLHARVGYSHTFQDGPGSRTMQAVGWATGKVAPGTISVSDSFTGADQFVNTLKKSGTFDGAELAGLRSRFMTLGQNERNMLVSDQMKDMVYRIADKHGMSKEMADLVTENVMSKLHDGRAFAARALEKSLTKEDKARVAVANAARKANQPGTVTLMEPGSQVAISVPHGLLEGHMAMSAPSLDPTLIEKIIKHHVVDERTGVAKIKADAAKKVQGAADLGLGLTELYTQVWKFGVLGRPGLMTRALLDTQLRSAMMIGGMHTLLNAGTGTKNAAKNVGTKAFRGGDTRRFIPPTRADEAQALWHDAQADALLAKQAAWGGHDSGNAFFKDESAAYKDELGKPMRSPKIDRIAERNQLKRDQLFERHQDLQSKLETLRGRQPKTPKQQARHEQMIANAEARVEKVALELERVQDPTHIAKAARSGYLKGNASHPANLSRDEKMANTIAAHRATAESLRTGAYDMSKFGLGMTDKTVTLRNGEKVTTSAYSGSRDREAMDMALTGGGTAASSVMTANLRADIDKVRELSSWNANVLPGDPNWAHRYVRSTDALRNSPTARRLMHAKGLQDNKEWHELYRTLRGDKSVKAEWAKLSAIHPDFEQWMQGVVRYVGYYVRHPEVNETLLRGGRMSTKDVERLIPKNDRFAIHGPDLEYLAPPAGVQAFTNMRDKMFELLLDKPDKYLVRHPTYVTLYNKNFKELANRWVKENDGSLTAKGQAEIEGRARHRAVQDIKRIMYDPAHLTNAQQTLRFLAPFIRPWEDAMRSWSRLIYDDPHVLGKLALAWESPNIAGLVVNEKGDKVPAYSENPHGGQQEYIVTPVPAIVASGLSKATFGWLNPEDITHFRIRKDALNSIAQGDTPWLPGFGPAAQIPVQLLAARFFPEIYGHADNAVMRSMFLGGNIPKAGAGDLARSQMPGYARAAWDAFDSHSGTYSRIYQTTINTKIAEAQQQGKDVPGWEELDKAGAAAARSGGLIRAIASGMVGMSGMVTPEGNFYVEQYQTLKAAEGQLKAQGKTVDDVFAAYYPEAADLPWSISMNETGINATVKADLRARTLKNLIDKQPEYGWFVVGTDNVGGQFSRNGMIDQQTEFSDGVYNAQFSMKYGLKDLGRRGRDKGEILDRALQAKGWAQYSQIDAAVTFAMKQQGFTSLNQKGAAELADKKDALVERMKIDNPVWAADFEDRNGGKVDQFLRFANTVMDDKRLKDRPDIVTLKKYLGYRDMAVKLAESEGYTLAAISKAAPIRARLNEIGSALAQQDLGFDQVWQRVLAGEVENR